MNKTWQLPKEFAEKWIEALESGKYQQAKGILRKDDSGEETDVSYCCLGIAGKVLGVPDEVFRREGVLDNIQPSFLKLIPEPLLHYSQGPVLNMGLALILSKLNDGNWNRRKDSIMPKTIVWSIPPGKYDFKQIAQFIKDNVEFV